MSRDLRRRRRESPQTGKLRLGSGADPGAVFETAFEMDRKTLQACAQARRALEFGLAVDCRDALLSELAVIAVVPDPTIRRLRVWLRGPRDMSETTYREIVEQLEQARGFLRARVAEGLCRKRTPDLAFEVVLGAGSAQEEDAS